MMKFNFSEWSNVYFGQTRRQKVKQNEKNFATWKLSVTRHYENRWTNMATTSSIHEIVWLVYANSADLNLKEFNKNVAYHHFNMDNVHTAIAASVA